MPIRDLTDKQGWAGANLPRLGKLFKGDKKRKITKGDREIEIAGKDLEYFRVEFEPQYEFIREQFIELYGNTPTEFRNVTLMGATVEEAFPNFKEERTRTKLVHECDGETQYRHWETGQGLSREPIACVHATGGLCACKPRGHLKLLLNDLSISSGVWGYLMLETGSSYDIKRLDECLKFWETSQGSLNGIYFTIGRAPQNVPIRNPEFGKKKDVPEVMIKPMSLLYAMPEPQQAKLLFQNYQAYNSALLSRRVDPSSGELAATTPQAMLEASTSQITISADTYDYDALKEATSGMYTNPYEQENSFAKMLKNGELHDGLDLQAAIEVVKAHRTNHSDAGENGDWWTHEPTVQKFKADIKQICKLEPLQILEALNAVYEKPRQTWKGFKGLSYNKAWALCLIYKCEGDFAKARKIAKDTPEIMSEIARYELDAAFAPQ